MLTWQRITTATVNKIISLDIKQLTQHNQLIMHVCAVAHELYVDSHCFPEQATRRIPIQTYNQNYVRLVIVLTQLLTSYSYQIASNCIAALIVCILSSSHQT